jgi:AcrR family transcriptional regulator
MLRIPIFSSQAGMSFRAEQGNQRGRAHTAEDKARVRQQFIDVGQRLMMTEPPEAVSLRRIATESGYSPGTVYQYFRDHRELLFAIREFDMNAATDLIEAAAAGEADPALRVRKLFLGSVRYWLDHLEHFDLLFSGPLREPHPDSDSIPFGQSAAVRRSLKLYRDAVESFFESLPRRPMDAVTAADILIAASHGIVAFPRLTNSMAWSDTGEMAKEAIDALLRAWIDKSHAPSSNADAAEPAPPAKRSKVRRT